MPLLGLMTLTMNQVFGVCEMFHPQSRKNIHFSLYALLPSLLFIKPHP